MTACLEYQDVYGSITTESPSWSGAARSIISFSGECWFGFEVPRASVGVVVGLNTENTSAHYLEIDHALHFARGNVRTLEAGANSPGVGPIFYEEGDRFYIMRTGTTVVYMHRPVATDDEAYFSDIRFPGKRLPGGILYVSGQPSFGTVFLDISMYAVGDQILNEAAGEVWAPEDTELVSGTGGSIEPYLPFEIVFAAGVNTWAELEVPFTIEAGGSTTSGVVAELPFTVLGADTALDSLIIADLPFTVSAEGSVSGTGNYPALAGIIGYVLFDVEATGIERNAGIEAEMPYAFVINGTADGETAVTGGGNVNLTYTLLGSGSEVSTDYFHILLSFNELANLPPEPVDVTEGIYVSADVMAQYAVMLRDFLRIVSTLQTYSEQSVELLDIATAVAEAVPNFALAIQDALNVTDTITLVQAVEMADSLVAAGLVQTFHQAIVAVTSALLVGDGVIHAESTTVEDDIAASDSLQGFIQLLALLTDSIGVAATLQNVLTIIVEETAEVEAADTLELSAQYFANLFDRTEVLAFIKTPAELAQGWVMNTEEAMPVSEYSNYVFNSLAYGPDEMLGCNDQGLYVLDGDDDAGTDIDAEIASLMLDFQTTKLKRMSTAYIGYTSTGQLMLKVRSVDQGLFVEHWYAGRKTTAQTPPGQNRMKIGKGLRSRYWTFELVNVDGSDFELDKVELYPIVLDRRV